MKTKDIRCPSGLRGNVRSYNAEDFHNLVTSGSDDEPDSDYMADLAAAVWQSTEERAAYDFDDAAKPPFKSDILIGDRTEILLRSRILTSGGTKPIQIKCDRCGAWFSKMFDYEAMPRREWPNEGETCEPDDVAKQAMDNFRNGEPCTCYGPDGEAIKFNLLTGGLLKGRIAEYGAKFGDSPQSETAARIVDIEGMDFPEAKNRKMAAMFGWVKALGEVEFWDLWDDIQDQEAGPETDVRVKCPHVGCGFVFAHQVDTVGFILPTVRRRSMRSPGTRSRRKTSGAAGNS